MAMSPKVCLPSGYDEEFVNVVDDDCHCSICQLPLREPVQTTCGHRFCRQCLDEHLRRQEYQHRPCNCPVDREELAREKNIFPDRATERKILSFIIRCPSEGCEWTGELREKKNHLISCPFKIVSCSNKNCEMTVPRKDLEEHVTTSCEWRVTSCEHCKESLLLCQHENHISKCKKYPVTCPNNCGAVVPREEIPKHTDKDCPLTIISCPYVQMGCASKVQREQLESHLQSSTRLHLDLACMTLNNTQEELQETKKKLEEKVDKQEHDEQIMTLNNNQEELQEAKKKLEEHDVQMQDVLRKLEDLQKTNDALGANVASQEKEISSLKDKVTHKPKQPLFTWKISGFTEILNQAKKGQNTRIDSDAFYTGEYGYKLKAFIFPNGYKSATTNTTDTHLSVYVAIMKGEYDAVLPWPFHQKVKFTLIDQQDDPNDRENVVMQFISDTKLQNFGRPKTDENLKRGYPRFISHEKLRTRRFVVDDVLFIQVLIGPLSEA